MSFSETSRNIRIPRVDQRAPVQVGKSTKFRLQLTAERLHDDKHDDKATNFRLTAECLQDDGSYAESSINLYELLGNEDGAFQHFGTGFSLSGKSYKRNGVVLQAKLKDRRGEWKHAEVNLDQLIANDHGRLCVQQGTVTCPICHGFLVDKEVRMSKASLEKGVATHKCAVCTMLLRTLEHYFNNRKQQTSQDAYCIVRPPITRLPVIEIHASSGQSVEVVELYAADGANASRIFRSIPAAKHFSRSSTSNESISLAKQWLEVCGKNHRSHFSSCPVKAKRPMPTRVVDVGSSESDPVRLHVTNGEDNIYACLSHVWGSSKPMVSQSEHLNSLQKDGIPWSQLDNTYKDAITFCRKLQIRYLWVDSLCIIQNDGADWLRESVKMAQYYGNAYICLAASASADHEHGFFVKNQPPLKVSGTGPDGLPYCVYVRPRISHLANGDHDAVAASFPLTMRGWCYQERRLAPRILHFGRHEMAYECSVADHCECGMSGDVTGWTKASEQPTSIVIDERKAEIVPDEWRKLVVSYSPLNLTRPTDRLVAFSGLAKMHAERRRRKGAPAGKYMAGLWENTLPNDMLWQVGSSDDRKDKHDRLPGLRPTTVVSYPKHPQWKKFVPEESPDFIAPSWSWASVLDPVTYQHYQGTPLCKIEQVKLAQLGDDPFGPLKAAHMVMETVVLETKWHFAANEQVFSFDFNARTWRFWPDYDLTRRDDFAELASAPVYIAAIVESTRRLGFIPEAHVESIVLIREKAYKDTYSRIGRTHTRLLYGHSNPRKRDDGMIFGPGRSKRMKLAIA